MYYVMHFYVENDMSKNEQEKVVLMLNMFSKIFNVSFDYIGYELFNPDKDGYLKSERYDCDKNGIDQFKRIDMILRCVGKNGEIATPIIYAADEKNSDQWIGNGYVQCIYPANDEAMLIILYLKSDKSRISSKSYVSAIRNLNEMGYHVNNSFVDYFFTEKGPFRLTGLIYTSPFSFFEKRDRSYRVIHAKRKYKDHIRDIYTANSILQSAIGAGDLLMLTKLLGEQSVCQVDDSIVFSICDLEKLSCLYRIEQKKMINRLRKSLPNIIG